MASFAVLHLLTREPGGSLRVSELAERTRLTVSGISRIVATLCEQGLAERQPDHEDGRAWRIGLTAEGEAQVAQVLPEATRFVREQFTDRFSGEEIIAIRRYCERLEEPQGNEPSTGSATHTRFSHSRISQEPGQPRAAIERPGAV